MQPPKFTRSQALGLLAGGIACTVTSIVPAQAAEVAGEIGAFWRNNPDRYGQPIEAKKTLNSLTSYQRFAQGIIIWTPNFGAYFLPNSEGNYQYHPASGMLRNMAKTLGSTDALVIGDSQVWEGSWVGQGIRQAGFTPHFHSYGGIGFRKGNRDKFPSYHDGVVNNAFPLPLGNPGCIYIGGSGNDASKDPNLRNISIANARQTVRRLKEIYPTSPIVLSEVLSQRIEEHQYRHALSEDLATLSKEENLLLVPNRYWVTDKKVNSLVEADKKHLTPAGQDALAPYLGDWLRWNLGIGFNDVRPGVAFYQEMNWMRTAGISTGWADGSYRPWNQVQRQEMAAFFYRLAGSPAFAAPAASPFKDLAPSHPFYQEITWMQASGIAQGWADGTFRPSGPVNRDAMAAFFYRISGAKYTPLAQPFADVSTRHPFYREIAWMKASGISSGWADGSYRPDQPVLRDQMAAFIYRYKNNRLS